MLCFRKFPVAKKFMDKRGGGVSEDFPSKFFCLTVPKIFVGESFTVAVISGTGKVWIRRGEYQDFPLKIFCLTVPRISLRNLSVSENFWYRKMLGTREGAGITIFRQNCFVSQYRKNS